MYWLDKNNKQSSVPFPIDEATFVVDRWSDTSYLKGQKFKQYVMFEGYEEGFIQYTDHRCPAVHYRYDRSAAPNSGR